jgi:mannose-1-phosphate guanylyltransferase
MRAVLLAAGEGTRLRPLTLHTPKCLVLINGKPLIDFWLEMLVPCKDIEDIFINVSYLKEHVVDHIQSNWSTCDKITLWHEEKLLGTAGTLKTNYDLLKKEDVLVIHADNLSTFDLPTFIKAHKGRPSICEITMMLFKTDSPESCGIVEIDKNGIVQVMHEKTANPPGNLANGAVYIFSKESINWIKVNDVQDISSEVIPQFLTQIFSWENDSYHRDIGSPQSYSLAQQEFNQQVNT